MNTDFSQILLASRICSGNKCVRLCLPQTASLLGRLWILAPHLPEWFTTDLFRVWKSKLSPAVIKECLNHALSWTECMDMFIQLLKIAHDRRMLWNFHVLTYIIMLLKHLYYSGVDTILLTFLKTYNSCSKFKK